jgi:23S rRNA (uracil1939-C5)-methyltransferase
LECPEDVLDVDEHCLLPEQPVLDAWRGLRAEWGPGADRLPDGPELRLTLRGNHVGEVLLLVRGGRGRGDPDHLVEHVPSLRAIWKVSERPGAVPRRIAGSRVDEVWHGEAIELPAAAFLQGNRAAAEACHQAVLDELPGAKGKRVLDAYCGFGLYGLHMVERGASVVGIESDPDAARMAETGARGSSLRILTGSVEDRYSEALPADLVILNPPRQGVGPGLMEALGDGGAERIVYVSCDPATLARDARRLGARYRIARLQAFDLFPQTAHIEVVLTFDRR